MKLVLLADVHGNLEALDAVLRDAAAYGEAQLVVAGDIVGYGPDPEACLWRLLDAGALMVRGNHEEMVLGWRPLRRCVHAGISAAVWTRRVISDEARDALASLPLMRQVAPGVVVCHGDLDSADTYVSDSRRASAALAQLRRQDAGAWLLITGHTHHAALARDQEMHAAALGEEASLAGGQFVLNPGAVGQARRGEPLARYAVLDVETRTVRFAGVPYAHAITERKLERAGLRPRVVLEQPRGLLRHVEAARTRLLRLRL